MSRGDRCKHGIRLVFACTGCATNGEQDEEVCEHGVYAAQCSEGACADEYYDW